MTGSLALQTLMNRTWWRERGTLVPLALVTVFTFRLAVASAVIPPWQIPDEPQHVAIIQILLEQAHVHGTCRTRGTSAPYWAGQPIEPAGSSSP